MFLLEPSAGLLQGKAPAYASPQLSFADPCACPPRPSDSGPSAPALWSRVLRISTCAQLQRVLIFVIPQKLTQHCKAITLPVEKDVATVCHIFKIYFIGVYFGAFPGGASHNPPASAGDIRDASSILGLGRSPGGAQGNPPQYSCLKNLMHRGAWQAAVHGIAKNRAQLKHLSTHAHVVDVQCLF